MMNRLQFLAALLALPFARQGRAATGASAPVRLVVGYAAGATLDTLARRLAARMAPTLGRSVIVENRPGAGGRIASEWVRNAPADGLTLLLTPSAPMAIFPHSHAGPLRYDPLRDFMPVAHLCRFQTGLAVGRSVPANTLADYLAWVRTDPQRHGFYASAATGSTPHFMFVMLARAEGVALTHVPYPGTAAAMRALATGEIAALATGMGDLRTLVRSGQARVLAINGEQRDPVLGDVPTFRELGYDLASTSWYALFARNGVSMRHAEALSAAALDAVADPAMRRFLVDQGLEPTAWGPQALAAVLASDHERWGRLIRATGFQVGN
jgi:tripartite-type tricarboxylate transporter receptor subunit TctC